jgi:hypothetical protein
LTGLLLAVLVLGAIAAETVGIGIAIANGDPASDVLLQQDVFLPYQPQVCPQVKDALESATSKSSAAGYPIKVAVIGSPYDLGTEPSFFGHAPEYAAFLGKELRAFSPHLKRKLTDVPLLVVMPQGLALWEVDPRLNKIVQQIAVSSNADTNALARSAVKAVPKIATAAGHPTGPIEIRSGCSSKGNAIGTILPFGVPILLLVFVGLLLRFRRTDQDTGR